MTTDQFLICRALYAFFLFVYISQEYNSAQAARVFPLFLAEIIVVHKHYLGCLCTTWGLVRGRDEICCKLDNRGQERTESGLCCSKKYVASRIDAELFMQDLKREETLE